MSYIRGVDREQSMLLPERVEDYVPGDHPVRFVDAFVEGLDLALCGFQRTEPKETGRPPFAPGDFLKLYLWGYLNQVRSSRRLERECARNLELMWLMRQLRPDFKTIADFRRDNAKAFKMVFRQFNLLCRELGLFGRELVAIDGTKLKAVNNPARYHDREKLHRELERIDAKLEEFLGAMEEADGQQCGQGGGGMEDFTQKIQRLRQRQGQCQQALHEMEQSGIEQVALTDPEAVRLHKAGIGYNGQIAVDDKHKLIAAQDVVNEPTDHGQLAPMAQAAKQELGVEKLKAVADGGYYNNVQIDQCGTLRVEACVPRPHKGSAAGAGLFEKEQFHYDAAADCYRCPGGESLGKESECLKRGQRHILYSNAQACRRCPLKGQCTPASYRRMMRWENEAALDRMHARVKAAPELIARRKALAEHPFGAIKFWMNQDAFLMRGLENVRAEFSLATLSYNMKRVFNIVGVPGLLCALRKRAGNTKSFLATLAHALDLRLSCHALWPRKTSRACKIQPLTLSA